MHTLSVTEAAKQFGYSRAWVQKLLINGTLKGEKDSRGYWRVSASAMQGKEKHTWTKRRVKAKLASQRRLNALIEIIQNTPACDLAAFDKATGYKLVAFMTDGGKK